MKRIILTLLVAAALPTGCGRQSTESPSSLPKRTGALTRPLAAQLLKTYKPLSEPATERIFLGSDFRNSDFIGFGNWAVTDALVKFGYLQRTDGRTSVTSKSEADSQTWGRDPQRPDARFIPVAVPRLVEVTGITGTPGAGEAGVEFTWKWELTEIGRDLSKELPKFAAKFGGQPQMAGTAAFQLYDDGWRVREVSK